MDMARLLDLETWIRFFTARSQTRKLVFRSLFLAGIVVLLATWIFCSPSSGVARHKPRGATVAPPVAAQWKFELTSPVEPVAAAGKLPLRRALAVVADAADAKLALLDDSAQQVMRKAHRYWSDPRDAAEGGEAGAARNWEIDFPKGIARDEYARQLDFFAIELAVILPNNQLQYASAFSKPKHTVRTAPTSEERRCYLTWQGGDLGRADRELLARAGIKAGSRVVVTILPRDVEAKLVELEKQAAGRDLDKVRRTRFGIHAAGNGYEFYVAEQFRRE